MSRDNHQVQPAQNALDKGIQEGSRQSQSPASLLIFSSCSFSQCCARVRDDLLRSLRWTPHLTLKRSAIALSSASAPSSIFFALCDVQLLIIGCCRYDRNHLAVTLRGIQKVTETRHKREADYHTLRMTKHVRFAALLCFRAFNLSHMFCRQNCPFSYEIRTLQQDACAAA